MATQTTPGGDDFREVVSRFPTGITVVTCVDAAGVDHAMTASSFVPLSLDPLLVSVCVERDSRFHAALASTNRWAVSILGSTSDQDARWFATRARALAGQLDRTTYHRGHRSGAAVLDGALAGLECTTWATYGGGDHDIVVGEVVGLELLREDSEPLVYFRRGFRRLVDPGSAPPVT